MPKLQSRAWLSQARKELWSWVSVLFCKRIFSGTHILIFDWRPQYSTVRSESYYASKKMVNQSSDFPVRRTGSYRHKKALNCLWPHFFGPPCTGSSVRSVVEGYGQLECGLWRSTYTNTAAVCRIFRQRHEPSAYTARRRFTSGISSTTRTPASLQVRRGFFRGNLHPAAIALMGLLQLRCEHDSSTIRLRFGYNTLQHATRFFVRSHTRSYTRISGRRVLQVDWQLNAHSFYCILI